MQTTSTVLARSQPTETTESIDALKLEKVFFGASAIHAIGHWVPDTRQSVKELEDAVHAPLEAPLNIEERIGVRERRVCGPDVSITEMAVRAVDTLLARGTFSGEKIDTSRIDLIIYFAVARECAEPATAVFVQEHFELSGATAFDIGSACLGFIDAWCVADAMIANGRIRSALLVSAERITGISNSAIDEINKGEHPRNHFAALSLGDGSVAVLVGPKNVGKKTVHLVAGVRESYSEHSRLCILPELHKPMITHASRLFGAALTKFPPLIAAVLHKTAWTIEDINRYITHQASGPSVRKGARDIGVPFEKTFNTLEEFGNMASVSVPFTLSKMLHEQPDWIQQKILMVGFGSGLGVGVLALET